MRFALAAALAAALAPVALLGGAFPALAEAAAGPSTRATLAVSKEPQDKVFDFRGDADWFRARLAKGADYYVSAACLDCLLALRGSDGRVLARGRAAEDGARGFAFRAPYQGLYFVEARDEWLGSAPTYPQAYALYLSGDCAAGAATRCELDLGRTRAGTLTDGHDGDAFRARLAAGRRYAVTMRVVVPEVETLALTAPGGATTYIPWSYVFTAPVAGTYLIEVGTEDQHGGGSYELTLATAP